MGLVDMHCHLLPGIDDSEVPADGLARVLEIYKECGFSGIAFTPHIYNPYVTTRTELLRETWEKAKALAEEKHLRAYLGSELFIGAQTSIKSIPIAGRYALAEFPTTLPMSGWFERLGSLVSQGMIPLVAHVERYTWLTVDSADFRRIKDLGCLIQVNVGGVLDGTALPYLQADVVDVMATDNHGRDDKTPTQLVAQVAKWPNVVSRMEALGL
jgi:protein-tyrosine phosphatase